MSYNRIHFLQDTCNALDCTRYDVFIPADHLPRTSTTHHDHRQVTQTLAKQTPTPFGGKVRSVESLALLINSIHHTSPTNAGSPFPGALVRLGETPTVSCLPFEMINRIFRNISFFQNYSPHPAQLIGVMCEQMTMHVD